MATKLVLQALVLADQIYVDARTGKKVIAGTFNNLWAPSFPAQFDRTTYAFICLTGIRDTVELILRYVDLRSNEVLMETNPFSVSCDNPLKSVEILQPVPHFPMPHEGVYAFEVYAGAEMLGSLRISASKKAPEGGQ